MTEPVEVIFRWRGDEANRGIEQSQDLIRATNVAAEELKRGARGALDELMRFNQAAGIISGTRQQVRSLAEEMERFDQASGNAARRQVTDTAKIKQAWGDVSEIRGTMRGVNEELERFNRNSQQAARPPIAITGSGERDWMAARGGFPITFDPSRGLGQKGGNFDPYPAQARVGLELTEQQLNRIYDKIHSLPPLRIKADTLDAEEKARRIEQRLQNIKILAEATGRPLTKAQLSDMRGYGPDALRQLDFQMRGEVGAGASRVLARGAREVMDVGKAVKTAGEAVEGSKRFWDFRAMFTANTENGRKFRAVLYDIANQAGLPGVSRGLGVFGGAPLSLIAGFAFLETARMVNSYTEEIRKASEETLKFQNTMANFGLKGGGDQRKKELGELAEAYKAVREIAALGQGTQAQLAELNRRGLRKPGQEPSALETYGSMALSYLVGGGNAVNAAAAAPLPGAATGIKDVEELKQRIREGEEQFLKLQRLNQQAGRESMFTIAERTLKLDIPHRFDELNEGNRQLEEFSDKARRGQLSSAAFSYELEQLNAQGKKFVDTFARQKLDSLNKLAESPAFLDEAMERGISTAELYAEKFGEIQREVQMAKAQLQEFNRASDEALRLQERRNEFQTSTFKGISGAFNQITGEQLGGNDFLRIFDKYESRMQEFRARFGNLSPALTNQYQGIAQGILQQDIFRAELSSQERLNQLLIQGNELRENSAIIMARERKETERTRQEQELLLNLVNQRLGLQVEREELMTGRTLSPLERADFQLRRIANAGLGDWQWAQAVMQATGGLSLQQLQEGGFDSQRLRALRILEDRAATLYSEDRTKIQEQRRATAEKQAADLALQNLRGLYGEGANSSVVMRLGGSLVEVKGVLEDVKSAFEDTPEGRAKEAAALDDFLRRSAIPAEELTDELREARIKANERRAEIEKQQRKDAQEVEDRRAKFEEYIKKAITDFMNTWTDPKQWQLRIETDDGKERTELLKVAGK